MAGICADGTIVFNESQLEDGRNEIVIPDTDPEFFNCLISSEPVFTNIEPPFYEWVDIDEYLLGNYGKDWLYGQMAFPAANGWLGPIARENYEFALNHVLSEIDWALNNAPVAYAFCKFVFNLVFGSDEFETNLRECLSQQPAVMDGLDDQLSSIREDFRQNALGTALGILQRSAGGFLVAYVSRGGRYGKKILEGQSRTVRNVDRVVMISYNLIMASLGAAIRCVWEKTVLTERYVLYDDYQARIRAVEPPRLVHMLVTAIVGDADALDGMLDSDGDLFAIMNGAGLCYFDDPAELAVFQELLSSMRDGGTGNLR